MHGAKFLHLRFMEMDELVQSRQIHVVIVITHSIQGVVNKNVDLLTRGDRHQNAKVDRLIR